MLCRCIQNNIPIFPSWKGACQPPPPPSSVITTPSTNVNATVDHPSMAITRLPTPSLSTTTTTTYGSSTEITTITTTTSSSSSARRTLNYVHHCHAQRRKMKPPLIVVVHPSIVVPIVMCHPRALRNTNCRLQFYQCGSCTHGSPTNTTTTTTGATYDATYNHCNFC